MLLRSNLLRARKASSPKHQSSCLRLHLIVLAPQPAPSGWSQHHARAGRQRWLRCHAEVEGASGVGHATEPPPATPAPSSTPPSPSEAPSKIVKTMSGLDALLGIDPEKEKAAKEAADNKWRASLRADGGAASPSATTAEKEAERSNGAAVKGEARGDVEAQMQKIVDKVGVASRSRKRRWYETRAGAHLVTSLLQCVLRMSLLLSARQPVSGPEAGRGASRGQEEGRQQLRDAKGQLRAGEGHAEFTCHGSHFYRTEHT